MNPFFTTLTLTYLIYPILGLLLVGLGIFIAKKNQLLSNKRFVFYFLISVAVLVLPALLGFLDYNFMPYGYILLSILYIILGAYNIGIVRWVFKGKRDKEYTYRHEIILVSFLVLTSMLFFALVFNLCNELKYGAWAATCILPFVVVSIFMQTYRTFISIPIPVYTVWKYEDTKYPDTYFDPGTLQVLQIELYKQESDMEAVKLNVKAPDEMEFGSWFRLMIDDYNRKSPQSPIDSYAAEEDGGWMFYMKPSLISPRRYIDFNETVKNNRIRNKHVVVAKRVKEHTN